MRHACLDVIATPSRDCADPSLHKPRLLRSRFPCAPRLRAPSPRPPAPLPRLVAAHPCVCACAGPFLCSSCSGVVLAATPSDRSAALARRVLQGHGRSRTLSWPTFYDRLDYMRFVLRLCRVLDRRHGLGARPPSMRASSAARIVGKSVSVGQVRHVWCCVRLSILSMSPGLPGMLFI